MEIINARPMPESHVKRVADYCRISMETDRTHKSLSTQISHYNELIDSTPGCVFAGVFADNGISGTSIEARTEFIRMIDKARAGEIDIILTKSVSRFARNTVDLLSVVRELRSMGVEVRFERENISTLSGEGELLLTLLASFAQAESDQQSQSVKWGIRRRFQQGQHNGFSLYGYTNHGKGRVEINEAEAAVVRRIFDYYLAKVSAEQMARIFEAEGVVGPTGAALEATTIRNILATRSTQATLCSKNTSRSALAATPSSTKESKTSTGSKTRIRPSSILTCGSRFKTREKTAGRKGPRQTGRSRPQTSPTCCSAHSTTSTTGHRYALWSTARNGDPGRARQNAPAKTARTPSASQTKRSKPSYAKPSTSTSSTHKQ